MKCNSGRMGLEKEGVFKNVNRPCFERKAIQAKNIARQLCTGCRFYGGQLQTSQEIHPHLKYFVAKGKGGGGGINVFNSEFPVSLFVKRKNVRRKIIG